MTYASPSSLTPLKALHRLQVIQNKLCRAATDAHWCVRNSILHRDLELPTISKYMKDASKRFFDIAGSHPNALLRAAVDYQPPHPTHLIRHRPKLPSTRPPPPAGRKEPTRDGFLRHPMPRRLPPGVVHSACHAPSALACAVRPHSDLKTFTEEDFDPKTWINTTWSASGSDNKKEFVTKTVSKLQLYIRQLSNSLNEATDQIMTTLPRVAYDFDCMKMEANLLVEKFEQLHGKVEYIEEKTGESIRSLQRIDTLKSRLENAASALKEADKWAHLATSLENILENGVPTSGEKLEQLTEQVLSETADYESKQVQLEGLYNRLEAALGPALIDALAQRNTSNAAALVATFIAMSRGAAPIRYWRRVEASQLAAGWQRPQQPTTALRELRAELAHHAYDQVEWLKNVLKCTEPMHELVRLYTDLLLSLDPSPSKIVSASLKHCSTPQDAIELLTDVRMDIDGFVSNFNSLLDVDKRKEGCILPAAFKELGKVLYAPLKDSLEMYIELQAQVLTSYLKSGELEQADPLEKARAIQSIVERSDAWFANAHSAARKLAGTAVYPYFIPAVEAYISALCSQLSATNRQIETEFLSSSAKGLAQGVLSSTFPASLILGSAATALLSVLASLREELMKNLETEDPKDLSPLPSLELLLLDDDDRNMLLGLRKGSGTPWAASAEDISRLCRTLRSLAVNILLEPVALQLEKIPHLKVWTANDPLTADLPDFALSPQEYITVVGQYLMTLPQHLEPHMTEKQDPWQFVNESLISYRITAYSYLPPPQPGVGGKRSLPSSFRFPSSLPPPSHYLHPRPPSRGVGELEAAAPVHRSSLVDFVCTQTCDMYSDKILNVRNLDELGTKRCLTDIAYLSSVLEDLGCSITSSLKNLEKSLRATTPKIK
ncbi:Conserved oligomeric Golgi complex subunit 7 [Eumeta japonica]|uniref:Conserved oligomeric Golgi complex subunit 7 n=1 Tax=Eumeta variegata TaxID=151549 RepID=A0A4C1WRI0_EUMVA|nr:Conserved oligomeric Golgi complex subunit 7 [Eumeta japonica]